MRGLQGLIVLATLAGCVAAQQAPVAVAPARTAEVPIVQSDAELAYRRHDYEKVVSLTDQPLGPDHPVAARVGALEVRGAALAVLGRDADAQAAFEQVFVIDPDAQLPGYLANPDLRQLFETARGAWRARVDTFMHEHHAADLARIELAIVAPDRAQGGRPFTFQVKLTDPAHLGTRLRLAYRRELTDDYTVVPLTIRSGAPIELVIPDAVTESDEPYRLEYYAVLRAENGADLAAVGSPVRPLELAVAAGRKPPPPPPAYKTWWFWTGVAVLTVGSAIAVDYAVDVGPQNVEVQLP